MGTVPAVAQGVPPKEVMAKVIELQKSKLRLEGEIRERRAQVDTEMLDLQSWTASRLSSNVISWQMTVAAVEMGIFNHDIVTKSEYPGVEVRCQVSATNKNEDLEKQYPVGTEFVCTGTILKLPVEASKALIVLEKSSVSIVSSSSTDSGADPVSAESLLLEKLTRVVGGPVVIHSGRNKNNKSSPRIAIDFSAKGTSCSEIQKTADILLKVGRVLAADGMGRTLPHVQYWVRDVSGEKVSVRIIRMTDLIEVVKSKESAVRIFSRGRIISGESTIDGCLPKMNGGPEGEDWETMYGVPDPRPEILRKYQ
jgi:hypothetical protein